MRIPCLTTVMVLLTAAAQAGDADVIAAQARRSGANTFDFDVTVQSRDTGWNAYADLLEAVAPDGTVLGQRELLHPHDDEQPFTRDLYGVRVPAGIGSIRIRARFKPTGYGGKELTVDLSGVR